MNKVWITPILIRYDTIRYNTIKYNIESYHRHNATSYMIQNNTNQWVFYWYGIHSYCHRLHYYTELYIVASNYITNTILILQEDLHSSEWWSIAIQYDTILCSMLATNAKRSSFSVWSSLSQYLTILECTIFDVHHVP